LKYIAVPALLVWGEKDRETPPYMARRLNKNIAGSRLAVLKGAGHFPHLEKPSECIAVIKDFLGGIVK
jgi:Predicted hydrolases or acyltransferases (alpha/beta hydrolase superfamily)